MHRRYIGVVTTKIGESSLDDEHAYVTTSWMTMQSSGEQAALQSMRWLWHVVRGSWWTYKVQQWWDALTSEDQRAADLTPRSTQKGM